jgi:hypothetical protein
MHDLSLFLSYAGELVRMGAQSFCIKDMAGLLTPNDAYELVSGLKTAYPDILIHLHCHYTSGLASMTYLKAVEAGADIFLGHHPHVPYGIERWRGGLIVHSLGNFVFRQPSRYWTQRSYALSAAIVKDSRGTRVEEYAVIPLLAGFRPAFAVSPADQDTVYQRVFALSSTEVTELVR